MINSGLTLMAVGMLVVFAFLMVMVVVMKWMSGYILKFFPETEESAAGLSLAGGQGSETEVAVAIAAAYTQQ